MVRSLFSISTDFWPILCGCFLLNDVVMINRICITLERAYLHVDTFINQCSSFLVYIKVHNLTLKALFYLYEYFQLFKRIKMVISVLVNLTIGGKCTLSTRVKEPGHIAGIISIKDLLSSTAFIFRPLCIYLDEGA